MNIKSVIGDMVKLRFLEKAGSELGLRLLSGAVLATVSIATAILGSWWFAGWVLVLTLAVTHEWFTITRAPGKWAAVAAVVGTWIAIAVQGEIVLALYVVVMGSVGTAMFSMVQRGGQGGLWGAAGTLYATIPLAALIWIRSAEGGGEPILWQAADGGGKPILWLFFVVWATDSGAYAVGRLVGGVKLAPSISPGKTWSGALGGLFVAMVLGVLFASLIQADVERAAIFAAIVSVAAQVGDLLQSALKRRFKVKDSGTLIPGHGGVMDRLDSLVIAAPVLVIVVTFVAFATGGMGG
ncbi:MAG: phosphatidate cytidylyltransferase [Rhodospirillaceae bacterium]|nr:phosphatidate cytidylyltransferase [Rhodospirillaceae bacterium]